MRQGVYCLNCYIFGSTKELSFVLPINLKIKLGTGEQVRENMKETDERIKSVNIIGWISDRRTELKWS